jgi:hypothetical protein
LTINYQYWTTEYIYTYGHSAGLAAAFLGYLSNSVGLNDLADAGYTPAEIRAIRARRGCARRLALSRGAPRKRQTTKKL